MRKKRSSRKTPQKQHKEPIEQNDSDDSVDDVSEQLQLSAPSVSKSKKKSGGFQSMGLSYPLMKGILKKGYKVPTPIQRKVIPVILEGKDVVAMARTGSGKTGAFLIPILEKLKAKTSTAGARALIFSPTRELALQTLKFAKELGRHTGLKTILVLGGEKIEDQFAAIHANPDIIIATPGRFLHLVMEMDLKLSSMEYVVFDEADRLFEMGFREQLDEVLHRLPQHRQTLMFSATLPCLLVDFVKAGLSDPVLIRLDVESKLSENLKTAYICCRPADKPAILLHLLKHVINITEELTVVFLATRHHVEYLKDILQRASIPCTYVYSSLDQTARKISVDKFKSKKVTILLVTDIAARGIDIPLLDNVINFNFPGKPKLFVHRVGRVARAGRRGTAYSLVAPDEAPYLLDLHLFLGKPITYPSASALNQDGICGTCPQAYIDDETDLLRCYHETSMDIKSMVRVCDNAYKQYSKSRPLPSSESVKRMKDLTLFHADVHPLFCSTDKSEAERTKFLANMKNYRPNSTIFEIGSTSKCPASSIMKQKRQYHDVVSKNRTLKPAMDASEGDNEELCNVPSSLQAQATESDIQLAFPSVVIQQSRELDKGTKKKLNKFKDVDNYVAYTSSQHYTEKGLGVQTTFHQEATSAVLDLTADDSEGILKQKKSLQWDRKRKKFFKDDGSEQNKKMKTESGVWIPKSYKSDLYKKWQSRHKVSSRDNDNEDNEDEPETPNRRQFQKHKGKSGQKKPGKSNRPPKREMRTKEEILKMRKKASQQKFRQKSRQDRRKIRQKKKGGKRGKF